MKKHPLKLNNSGSGLIEALVVLIVLALVIISGVLVYRHEHKTKPQVNTSNAAAANAYAGWHLYCDNTYHYCFKYPSGWSIKTATEGAATVLDHSKTVQVSYNNPVAKDATLSNFSPTYTNQVSASSQNLWVIGGYYTSTVNGITEYSPRYFIADNALLQTYPLTDSQGLTIKGSTQFPLNATFTDEGASGASGQLDAYPNTSNPSFSTASKAESWLASNDPTTALQMLQSFYYQH